MRALMSNKTSQATPVFAILFFLARCATNMKAHYGTSRTHHESQGARCPGCAA